MEPYCEPQQGPPSRNTEASLKTEVESFVDRLQAEGWEMREISTNTKVWAPGDTYETIELQVFHGPGRYQVFMRPIKGDVDAPTNRVPLNPNGL